MAIREQLLDLVTSLANSDQIRIVNEAKNARITLSDFKNAVGVNDLNDELDALDTALRGLIGNVEALVIDLDSEQSDLEDSMSTLSLQVAQVSSDLAEANTKITLIETNLSGMQQSISSISQRLDLLEEEE